VLGSSPPRATRVPALTDTQTWRSRHHAPVTENNKLEQQPSTVQLYNRKLMTQNRKADIGKQHI
jgi:hypothetical protein